MLILEEMRWWGSGSGYGGVVRMVGSGNKKGDGLLVISSMNIFVVFERCCFKLLSWRKLEWEKFKGKDEISGEVNK